MYLNTSYPLKPSIYHIPIPIIVSATISATRIVIEYSMSYKITHDCGMLKKLTLQPSYWVTLHVGEMFLSSIEY